MLVATVLTALCTYWNYTSYVTANNEAILRVATAFLESEELDKTEVVLALQQTDRADSALLSAYGYTADSLFFLEENRANLWQNMLRNLLVANGAVLLCAMAFYLFLRHRKRKIETLIGYLQQLQQKNYSLAIEENDEGELSKLQQELYQITVLLKEQAERSIADKQQVKNNIVDISHQLKTPLTSMSIMVDNLLDYPDMDDATRHTFLQSMRDRVSHMELLVQNLLKLSRFDANVIEFHKDKIVVAELIDKAVQNNGALLAQKDIALDIQCDKSICFTGDFVWQTEAVSNILKNAVEHSAQNGRIKIACTANQFATKLAITDYGTGISPENIKKIFTRYYKDQNADKNSLGVGLNLAKTIVEKDQGSITVTSKPNQTTTFTIRYL